MVTYIYRSPPKNGGLRCLNQGLAAKYRYASFVQSMWQSPGGHQWLSSRQNLLSQSMQSVYQEKTQQETRTAEVAISRLPQKTLV